VEEKAASPVELSIWIRARPETVFAFLIDPEKLVQWIGLAATLEARPGGIFRVDMNGRTVVRGNYLAVEPPRRVVFTWGHEDGVLIAVGSTTVEIVLISEEGGTRLRLRHSNLPSVEMPPHTSGWAHYLERLRARAEGRDPGPDPGASPDAPHGSRRI
jgi:uncharacterized protein YndB with AHSA1/START domain